MQTNPITTWIKLLLWAVCLAACRQVSPAAPTQEDFEPTSAVSSALTSTPALPTLTPTQRSLIPTELPTLTPTQRSLIPTELPTPDLVATAQAGSPAQLVSSQVSPDGLWWARVFSHPCPEHAVEGALGYDTLQFTEQLTGKDKILSSQLINCGGLGAYGLAGRYWAHTSRFYYFTTAASGGPDGCGYWEPPLLRVDVTDWSITQLGIGPLSPDGFKLAAWLDGELVAWDINGERLGSAPPPVEDSVPGPIAWAPDGKAVTYLLSEQSCPLGLTYIVRMSLSDFQPALFFASQDPSFAGIRWDTPNRVILTDENGSTWAYNFITGTLTRYEVP